MARVLHPDTMLPGLEPESKIWALKELVDALHGRGVVTDSLSFLQAVLERENLGSTVLDGEVAVPHARSRSVNRLGMAVGACRQPLDFPSGDDRHGVRLICLIAVPSEAPGLYLSLLAAVARTFGDHRLRQQLLEADDPEAMHRLLAAGIGGPA
ncbi:MAG: PTS sugar transporter subunit IIA [Gemmatimonadota bacterium]